MGDTRIGQMKGKDDPREVAEDGYEALMAGKATVVAGSFQNRIQAELGTHLPDALATPFLARMTKPQGQQLERQPWPRRRGPRCRRQRRGRIGAVGLLSISDDRARIST
jgi:hypothetical protein